MQKIVAELIPVGYLSAHKEERRNHYEVDPYNKIATPARIASDDWTIVKHAGQGIPLKLNPNA